MPTRRWHSWAFAWHPDRPEVTEAGMAGPPLEPAGQLFEPAGEPRRSSHSAPLGAHAPLAARLRPRTLDDMVGQVHLLGPGAPLRALIEADAVSSAILWGPPGTGKTTLARLMAETSDKGMVELSAVNAGVKDLRQVIDGARRRPGGTMLFLDEVHRFNKAQQDALLPAVENGLVVLVGATTENPFFELNPPLLSRSTLFRLEALSAADVRILIGRGLEAEGVEADDDAVQALIDLVDGDARAALTSLEVAVAMAGNRLRTAGAGDVGAGGGRPRVSLADVEGARGTRALRYGADDHFDLVSAFIKSIRGSDPDAGLYWLARMLAAGEDARFIARRLVILASEDVGLADPIALVVADAASRALEVVGLPEASLNLAQAVVHLATAPKSNRLTVALGKAQEDVRARRAGDVPGHLRDGHHSGMASLGHGVGYQYPHDDPRGWLPQEYRPPEVAGRRYYEPSSHGREQEIGEQMQRMHGEGGPWD